MAEFAAASAAAGVVSLGLTVCGGIITYYSVFRDRDTTLQSMLRSANELNKTLALISSRLTDSPHIELDTRERIETSLMSCRDAIVKLEKKLNKVTGTSITGQVIRKSLYPFKESTLIKMKEICNDCCHDLHAALETLHIDLEMSQLSKLDSANVRLVELSNGVRDVRGEITRTSDGVSTLVSRLKDDRLHQAFTWLSPLQGVFEQRQQAHFNVKSRQDRSGRRLIEHDKFSAWLSHCGRVLWCVGSPGIGKTVTTSFIVDHLQRINRHYNIGIAYVYCSYKNQTQESASNMMASIAQQLLRQNSAEPFRILELFEKHEKAANRPTMAEIMELLLRTVGQFSRVYIVVDALDECSDIDQNREDFVEKLTSLRPYVSICLISRPLPHLERTLDQAEHYELVADDQDIIEYVKECMSTSIRMKSHISRDPSLAQTIVSKILKKAKGMFLMAKLYLDSLMRLNTPRKVKAVLDVLPEGLTQVYQDALSRIQNQNEEDAQLALRTLYWIFHSRRPLTIRELCCALAVYPHDKDFESDGEPDRDVLISVCAGMAVIEEESQTVSLVHYTAREFFQHSAPHILADGLVELTQTCVTYLLFNSFSDGASKTDNEVEERVNEHPLLDHAAKYWAVYARDATCGLPEDVSDMMIQLLGQTRRIEMVSQIREAPHFKLPGWSQLFTRGIGGLAFAASLGLTPVVGRLIDGSHKDLDAWDSKGRTALHHAIAFGGPTIGASNTGSRTSNRTLSWNQTSDIALDIVTKLISSGANTIQPDANGQLPIHYAAAHNRVAIIKKLVESGAGSSLNTVDGYHGTPMYRAAEAGQLEAVQMLLEMGSDFDVQNDWGQTALHRAAEEDHLNIVRILIEHVRMKRGSEELRRFVGIKDRYGWTAMYRAADHGYTGVAKLLSAATRKTA